MAVTFTKDQQAAIDARGASVLVSAAAGSGKTAVLVERIIRLVSDEGHPMDIDRLLVVTFTNAAAAQMRERITQALSRAVEEDPSAGHLVRQLTLIHNAQITTIDSFCLYLIRNHFDQIGLDPDFRVADEGEIRLLERDVLGGMLEEYFAEGSQEFLDCVECFAPTGNEKRLEEQILGLYEFAMSHPWPEEWLRGHKGDHQVSADSLEDCGWVDVLKEYVHTMLGEAGRLLAEARGLCEESDGPYMYLDALEAEEGFLDRLSRADSLREWHEGFAGRPSVRLSSKKDERVSPQKREQAKALRKEAKEILSRLHEKYFQVSPEKQAERMWACAPQASMLLTLAEDYCGRLAEKKREKNLLDFHDMEHMALAILTERTEGEVRPSRTALELRERYEEIMIDEYQDSNLVQEYLLYSISGEEEGRYDRFMVGDVKQSIYKFRLARPELFMEKFERYGKREADLRPGDEDILAADGDRDRPEEGWQRERRIDLKQNFRSRPQVTDSVNDVFLRIMGKDLGGVAYDEDAALYPGAVFPEPEETGPGPEGAVGTDVYQTELLLTVSGEDGLEDRQREALAVAERIRGMVGKLPVTDYATGGLRPARYGDVVLLLRTTAGWDETFKKVLEERGIPVYITSRTGYFAATEVQTILNFLKVLNNPLQDIPLFGVLRSPVAGFTDRELAAIRAGQGKRKLYHSLRRHLEEGEEDGLRQKIRGFLSWFVHFRSYVAYMPIHRLIGQFLKETGYLYTVSALPGGEQRRANVEMLLAKAEDFEKTSYFGLFHFLRYMEQMEKYDIDYGEASLQDENADTVRIMSIHRSKGLEFPICFVCGLSKRFNLQDAARPVIMDMDHGIALDHVDITSRTRSGTLKKSVLAGKLQRDGLGEELRVLYVAMTRAKEKLILTGNCKEDLAEEIRGGSSIPERAALLPFALRVSAGCYLDWLLPAWLSGGKRVELQDASTLLAGYGKEELGRERLRLRLEELGRGEGQPMEGSAAERLRARMESVYLHGILSRLYTKTTVSELKKAGMEEAAEEAYHLFEEEGPVPYLPRFVREEEKMSGTARGSAYHKVLELFDFKKWDAEKGNGTVPQKREEADASIKKILDHMVGHGLEKEYREAVRPSRIARFLDSSLAGRMGRAAAEGRLFQEQPFVLGLPAKELDDDLPETETVLIQGIIDVYFEEEDGLVVADYKTDAVTEARELVDRYRVQLEYYARALAQITGKRVKEKIIYSFALQREIRL